jgi:predicted histone-like DNA-binding protein
MKVKVEKRKVGFGDNKKEMYVSKADRGGVYDIDDIAHQVALESGVNKRQFKAAVGCMVDAMIVFLKGGHGVSLKDFGTFLPEVKSQSSEDPEEVGVKRVRISFRPHKTLWQAVSGIGYTTENEFAEDAPTSPEGGEDNGSTDGENTGSGGGGQELD